MSSTVTNIPPNLKDLASLRQSLLRMVEKIDEAFGYRGNAPHTHNPQQSAISDASGLTDSSAEDKINEILAALRSSNIIG